MMTAKTDLPFAKIGLGCVTFGREINEDASFAMMDYAVQHGITFFDTAEAYGDGASERIIGNWLRSRVCASGSRSRPRSRAALPGLTCAKRSSAALSASA
jgi:aryl-alcohol dehydrogenase-like predicted oxidoreductase